jgi:hypothetical protein
MRQHLSLFVLTVTLGLSACVGGTPIEFADDDPANPNAIAGFVETPAAISNYKSSADFAERAAAGALAPPNTHGGMQGMPGMAHHNMPGMQHGGAPGGGASP